MSEPQESKPPAQKPEFSIARVLTLVVVIVGVAAVSYAAWKMTEKPVVLVAFSGRVMFDGKPVTIGGIVTQRLDDDLDGAVSALDEDGRFVLKTDGKPGAYVGRHKVAISANTPTMPPRPLIPDVYSSMSSSPLTIEVSVDAAENHKEIVLVGKLPEGSTPAPAARPAEETPSESAKKKAASSESPESKSEPETNETGQKKP